MPTQTTDVARYTIMEAATLSGLPESTLRYYETIGLIAPIERNTSSKHRSYSEDDINVVVAIACLSATGMTIKDMRTYLANRRKGAEAAQAQIDLLEAQKLRLHDQAYYVRLRERYVETKIAYWQAIALGDTTQAEAMSTQAKVIATELKLPIEQ